MQPDRVHLQGPDQAHDHFMFSWGPIGCRANTHAQVLCDRHPLTPKIDSNEGEGIEEEEKTSNEKDDDDSRNHEILAS